MMVGLQEPVRPLMPASLPSISRNRAKTLLVACDVYRPAAIKQLQVVGKR